MYCVCPWVCAQGYVPWVCAEYVPGYVPWVCALGMCGVCAVFVRRACWSSFVLWYVYSECEAGTRDSTQEPTPKSSGGVLAHTVPVLVHTPNSRGTYPGHIPVIQRSGGTCLAGVGAHTLLQRHIPWAHTLHIPPFGCTYPLAADRGKPPRTDLGKYDSLDIRHRESWDHPRAWVQNLGARGMCGVCAGYVPGMCRVAAL